jgi:hypothetical protein
LRSLSDLQFDVKSVLRPVIYIDQVETSSFYNKYVACFISDQLERRALLCIREVPGLSLCRRNICADSVFIFFFRLSTLVSE